MSDDHPGALKPILRKGRRLACMNSIWKVYLDHVVEEGGVEIPDYLVLELKTKPWGEKQINGVIVMPIVDGKIGMINIYRHAVGGYFRELPRGGLSEGESPEDCALRELQEETGLKCSPENLKALGYLSPESGVILGRAALFVAENCEVGIRTEHGELGIGSLEFFSFDDVRRMADESVIEDACSLSLIYRFFSTTRADLS